MSDAFIHLHYLDAGFDVKCERTGCVYQPKYRLSLGNVFRFWCEACALHALLDTAPYDPNVSDYINPDGSF